MAVVLGDHLVSALVDGNPPGLRMENTWNGSLGLRACVPAAAAKYLCSNTACAVTEAALRVAGGFGGGTFTVDDAFNS